MKSAAELRRSAGHADAAADFITRHRGGNQTFAVGAAVPDQRVGGRYGSRARVNDSDAVQIVHLKAVNQRAVGERRAGGWNLDAVAPNDRSFASAQFLGEGSNHFSPRQRRTEERAAEGIHKGQFDVRDNLLGAFL